MVPQTECKTWIRYDMILMQCKHTWHALGFRNQNLRHGRPHILGESTPLKGVRQRCESCPNWSVW